MRNRSVFAGIIPSLLFASLLLACEEYEKDPHPVDILRYPVDMVRGGEDGELLFVVGSNFDRRYSGGVLQVIDFDALNTIADSASFGGSPVLEIHVPVLGSAGIGSFGGRISMLPAEGASDRIFIPIRGEGSMAIVDHLGDGILECYPEGGSDCRMQALALPTPSGANIADPFATAVVGREVFAGALRTQRLDETLASSEHASWMARIPADRPEEVMVRSAGNRIIRDMAASPDGIHLYTVGTRVAVTGQGEIRSFPAVKYESETIPAEWRSLALSAGASDGRSLVFSKDASSAFVLTRNPSALVIFKLDKGFGGGVGSLRTRSVIPLPESPSRLTVIEEDGASLAFISSTGADAFAVVDLQREKVVAILDGTFCQDPEDICPSDSRAGRASETDPGIQPWSLVTAPRKGTGIRIWIASFGDGKLRAVDIPDLSRPWISRVVAVIGGEEN